MGHFNHSDGISVKVTNEDGEQNIGYSKVRDSIKAKCDISKGEVYWNADADWYFGGLNMERSTFYFFINMQ